MGATRLAWASARSNVGLERAQLADRGDDPQPGVGALIVSLGAHGLDHLPRLRNSVVAVKLNVEMYRAGDVEVGGGHGAMIADRASSAI